MAPNGRQPTKLATIAVATLLALAIVPVLAASASAAPVGAGVSGGASGEWAYGGVASVSYALHAGHVHYSLGAAAESDVIYSATNTTDNVTELTATRTTVVTVSESLSGPVSSWTFNLKLAEDDQAYANVTNAATVTLTGGKIVPALGILNSSLYANVSLAASLHGSAANLSVDDYLNASGSAHAAVSFTPALGLIPLNLSGVTGWSASALAQGSASWDVNWTWVDHGWNASGATNGSIHGNWSKATTVTVLGRVGSTYGHWSDHRARTAVGLALSGPFDLYGGILLVPHGFDLFAVGSGAIAGKGLGTTAITSESVFLSGGHVSARSITAANMTTSGSVPAPALVTSGSGGAAPAAAPATSGSGTTVWEQPESPQAAQAQGTCMQYGSGCPGGNHQLGALLLVLGVGGAVAIVAVALLLTRRRPPTGTAPAYVPVGASGATTPAPPAPPTGVTSPYSPNGPAP